MGNVIDTCGLGAGRSLGSSDAGIVRSVSGGTMRSAMVLRISAVAVVVLFFAGGVVLGQPPAGVASGQEVAGWFAAHGWQVRAAVWLWTVEALASAIFLGLARNQLPVPHRDVFFVGGVTFVAEQAVSTWILAGLSWHSAQLQPETARTLLDVASFFGPVLNGSTLAMLAPVVLLSWGKHPVLPRWLGVVGAVALVEQAVESVVTIFGESGFTEPGGAMNLQLGAALVSIWFICVGFGLTRASDAEPRPVGEGAGPAVSATG